VQKIILHTNFPLDPSFSMYERANFTLKLSDEQALFPYSNWTEDKDSICEILLGNRVYSEEMTYVRKYSKQLTTNYFGFDGMLVEVHAMRDIFSVTLFQ
jgi:hypothetical protein